MCKNPSDNDDARHDSLRAVRACDAIVFKSIGLVQYLNLRCCRPSMASSRREGDRGPSAWKRGTLHTLDVEITSRPDWKQAGKPFLIDLIIFAFVQVSCTKITRDLTNHDYLC